MVRPGHHDGAPGAPPWCARGTTLVRPGHHVGAPGAPSWCTDGTIVLHQLRGVHHFPLPPKELTRHLPLCFQQGFQCLSRLPVFSRHPDFPTEAPRWCSGHRLGALDTVLVCHGHHLDVPRTPSLCAHDTIFGVLGHHLGVPRTPSWFAKDTILMCQGQHPLRCWCAQDTILVRPAHRLWSPGTSTGTFH